MEFEPLRGADRVRAVLAVCSGDITSKADSAVRSIGCRGCHLDRFQGDGTTARLAGQWQEYLYSTMLAFRDGSRGNNPGMSDLMKGTPEDDFEALLQILGGTADPLGLVPGR